VGIERLDYAGMMRYLLIVLMFSVYAATGAQEIYRTVDQNGNVIFSDVPSKGSEKIKLKETTTIKSLNAEPSSLFTPPNPKQEESIPYKSISITAPANDEAIRDNAGNVSIKVALEPALRPGHQMVVYLDGKETREGTGNVFNLENIDRGTHQLRASVKDPDGHIVISSKSTTFHLLRHSVIKIKKPSAQ
jgi:hypothetical protein